MRLVWCVCICECMGVNLKNCMYLTNLLEVDHVYIRAQV